VHSFRRSTPAVLERTSSQSSGGADPCDLFIHPSGRYLFCANYSGSTVTALPIGPDGALNPPSDTWRFTGFGADPQRQAVPHPHMVTMRPGHPELVVTDLGTDEIHELDFDLGTGRFGAHRTTKVTPGSGPRQIVFSPDGSRGYVLGELDNAVTVLQWNAAAVRIVARLPLFPDGPAPGTLAAALLLDGTQLLASHRGADVISRVLIEDGQLRQQAAALPAGGRGPRHLATAGGWLYVANEISGTVVAMSLKGQARPLTADAPSATYLLPDG